MATTTDLVADAILEDRLVDLWVDYPCLYDVRSAEFKDRNKRVSAHGEIAAKLNQTDEWVKTKLKALRNSYTKAKKIPVSGSARKNLSKRSTWLLERLQFLAPHVAIRASVSSLEVSSQDCDDDDDDSPNSPASSQDSSVMINNEDTFSSTKKPLNLKRKSTKKKMEEEEYELIKLLTSTIANKQTKVEPKMDEIDTFCQFLGQSLRNLDPRTRMTVQHSIHNILFQAQMGPTDVRQGNGFFTSQVYPQMDNQEQSNTGPFYTNL